VYQTQYKTQWKSGIRVQKVHAPKLEGKEIKVFSWKYLPLVKLLGPCGRQRRRCLAESLAT
jgi:hypothetical protein